MYCWILLFRECDSSCLGSDYVIYTGSWCCLPQEVAVNNYYWYLLLVTLLWFSWQLQLLCSGMLNARLTGVATSKTKEKLTVGKSRTTAKEKEREKQLEAAETQFNTAMPHWTLRVVSDADVAVSFSIDFILDLETFDTIVTINTSGEGYCRCVTALFSLEEHWHALHWDVCECRKWLKWRRTKNALMWCVQWSWPGNKQNLAELLKQSSQDSTTSAHTLWKSVVSPAVISVHVWFRVISSSWCLSIPLLVIVFRKHHSCMICEVNQICWFCYMLTFHLWAPLFFVLNV